MNLEIAERLVALRKKHGLSQEDLAEKLGVSRQAISKWERVEASPDTDNLIALAKLYGVSLDELLNYTPENAAKDTAKESSPADDNNEAAKDADEVNGEDKEDGGFNVKDKDGKTKVHIGPKGIFVQDGDDVVDVSWNKGIHISSGDDKSEFHHNPGEPWHIFEDTEKGRREKRGAIADSCIFALTVIAYIVAGAVTNLWHPLWLLFLFTPAISVLFDYKKFNAVFPIIVVGVFLALGLFLDKWHPGWVVFLAIPAYYTLADAVKKMYRTNHPAVTFSVSDGNDKNNEDK